MNLLPGSKKITATGLVGPMNIATATPRPIRLFNIILTSGTSASVLSLMDGVTNTGDEKFNFTGTAVTGSVVNFAGGLRFGQGLYAVVDGNINYAVLTFTEEY